jgi:hypothetical protein
MSKKPVKKSDYWIANKKLLGPVLMDKTISLADKGIFTFIHYLRTEGLKVSMINLREMCPSTTVYTIGRALGRLKKAGYIKMIVERDEHGKIKQITYEEAEHHE